MKIEFFSSIFLLHSRKVHPQEILSVEIKKARELVDLYSLLETTEIDGVYGLFDEGKIVPNEAIHDNCLFIISSSKSPLKERDILFISSHFID